MEFEYPEEESYYLVTKADHEGYLQDFTRLITEEHYWKWRYLDYNWNILQLAIVYKRIQMIEILLETQHLMTQVMHRDGNEEGALTLALTFDQIHLALKLVNVGATFYTANNQERDPIACIMDLEKRHYVIEFFYNNQDKIPEDELAIILMHKHDLEIVNIIKYIMLYGDLDIGHKRRQITSLSKSQIGQNPTVVKMIDNRDQKFKIMMDKLNRQDEFHRKNHFTGNYIQKNSDEYIKQMAAHGTYGFEPKHAAKGKSSNTNVNYNVKVNKSHEVTDGYNYGENVLSINRAKGELEKVSESSEDGFEVDEKKRNEYLFKRSGFADFDQFDFVANGHNFDAFHSGTNGSDVSKGDYAEGKEMKLDDSHIGLLDISIHDHDKTRSGGHSHNNTINKGNSYSANKNLSGNNNGYAGYGQNNGTKSYGYGQGGVHGGSGDGVHGIATKSYGYGQGGGQGDTFGHNHASGNGGYGYIKSDTINTGLVKSIMVDGKKH